MKVDLLISGAWQVADPGHIPLQYWFVYAYLHQGRACGVVAQADRQYALLATIENVGAGASGQKLRRQLKYMDVNPWAKSIPGLVPDKELDEANIKGDVDGGLARALLSRSKAGDSNA